MNATAEHPNLYSTNSEFLGDLILCDHLVLKLPVRYELEEGDIKSSASSPPPNIVDWTESERFLRNLRGEHNNTTEVYTGLDRTGIRFFQYPMESSTAILVDLGESQDASGAEFDPGYQQVIDDLRSGGREIPAEDLTEMLHNIQEDPEEPEIKLFSLQAMARFLIKHSKFDDPIIGPDPIGIIQAEWHIIGDGLLVMAFFDDDQIHCVAQADTTPQHEALNRSVQLTGNQAIEEFGHLVPLR